MPDFHQLLYLLTEGRVSEVESAKRMPVKLAYDFLYKRRLRSLNEAIRVLEQYERNKNNK